MKSEKINQPEVWLRGKVPEIPDLLQPVAHALLQAREDVQIYMHNFPEHLLWEKPSGRASVGFHLQHLTGVVDRMLTYAAGKELSDIQFSALRNEGDAGAGERLDKLVLAFDRIVDEALEKLKNTPVDSLSDFRSVGRKKFPSSVIGLLFHAGEHAQRHVGQLLVTVSILKERESLK